VTVDEFCRLLAAVVERPRVRALWSVADRGMPVFAHSVDVALLCLDAYPEWRGRYPGFRLDVVVLGALLHDLTKVGARREGGLSHSQIMTSNPSIAVREAMAALDEAQDVAEVRLDTEGVDHLWHVIAAHHGPWGKVKPQTPEAYLLFRCDHYSATHHRTAPIDANDILPLLQQGYRWTQIGAALGVGRALIKARLQEACRSERLRTPSELLERWRERGHVLAGDPEQARQVERARFVVEFARRCPAALVESVRRSLVGMVPEE
jgi:hypothetical protein